MRRQKRGAVILATKTKTIGVFLLLALCAGFGADNPVLPLSPLVSVAAAAQSSAKPVRQPLRIQGSIKALTRAPRPGSVPYKDAVISLHLTQVKIVSGGGGRQAAAGAAAAAATSGKKGLLVYLWGMRANKLTPAAKYRVGQSVTLTLQPWEAVEDRYGGYNRREFDDEAVLSLPAYWSEAPR